MPKKLTILLVSHPYLQLDVHNEDELCGAYPVQSEVNDRFTLGLQDLGINVVHPIWSSDDRFTTLSLEGLNLDEIDAVLMDFNRIPPFIEEIKALGKPIAVYVPDFYVRHYFMPLVEGLSQFADLIIAVYPGAKDLMTLMGHHEIAEKTVVMQSNPIRLNLSNPADKVYDICYIGTGKRSRLKAIQRLLENPSYSFYINTAGRQPKEGNSLRSTEAYMRKMALSRFSVITSAATPQPLTLPGRSFVLKAPEVTPGRISESISVGCIPVYFQHETRDVPLFYIDELPEHPIVTICPEDDITTICAKLEHKYSTIKPSNFIDFHAQYFSAQVTMGTIISKWLNVDL